MIKQFWINLPVKDVSKSKAFFTQLGFSLNAEHGNTEHSACLLIGDKNVVVMLFEETMFKNFTQHDVTNTQQSTEVLFSIDAESREEVDDLAQKVAEAGGIVFSKPATHQGFMYGCAFTDLDGHRWNILHMNTPELT